MRRRQQGISLIEIMIALTLSSTLIAGVLQVFSNTSRTYRVQEALSRLQENGRFALDVLTRDIRQADFWGCLASGGTNIHNGLNSGSAGYDPVVHAFEDGIGGTEGAHAANAAEDAPDSIFLGGASGNNVWVVPPYMPTPSSNLKVTDGSYLGLNDIVLVSDCQAGDIFQVTNNPSTGSGIEDQVVHNTGTVSEGPGNLTGDLSKTYEGDAGIYRVAFRTFSIGADGTTGQPALFRGINGLSEQLVEGVENMQFLYGEDTDDNKVADYYVNADDVVDMERVVSVRVSLLLRTTEDNMTIQPQTYTYNGEETTAGDRRIRRVMSTTIAIRNRLD